MEEKKISQFTGKKSLIWLIIIIVLAAALIVMFFWQHQTKNELNQLLAEKELQRIELNQELDSLMGNHERVKTEYHDLADSLTIKDSVIQANAVEIKKLLDTQWEYYKVKKKLSQLQEIAQGYVHQMDSLYRVNDALTEENIIIKKDLVVLRKEKEQIKKDKDILVEQVESASVLKAYNIDAGGVRLRSGSSKEVITDKVRKIDKVKICFTLGENDIATPGNRDLYIRIARPDKEILTKTRGDDYTFEYEGKMLQYSILRTINYENSPVDICIYWNKQYSSQEMQTGLYHVDIFCDGNVIGHTTFTLR